MAGAIGRCVLVRICYVDELRDRSANVLTRVARKTAADILKGVGSKGGKRPRSAALSGLVSG
jgi:hypothetical protein